jgi:hypothetical protein
LAKTRDFYHPYASNDFKTKSFLEARYEEALKNELHDVQMYFYYAIKVLGFEDIIKSMNHLVIKSQNQVLIAYYLKDSYFSLDQVNSLKLLTGEEYWFQNYHLILYSISLKMDLDNNIKKYLIPERLSLKPNVIKEKRYLDFYQKNINKNHAFINEIPNVTKSITNYLNLRYKETAGNW